MARPDRSTYAPSFDAYIQKVPETDILEALRNQQQIVDTFLDGIPEAKHDYAYAPGKWTLKEMLQHVIDSERVFNYRALCFARRETASLPGFEEKEYAENSNGNSRSWDSLCKEFKAVRLSTNYLFESFTEDMLNHPGLANENPATALSLGFATVGHLYHHVYVIETRYLDIAESC